MIFNNLLPFKLSGVHRQHVSDGTVRYGCDRLVFKRRSTIEAKTPMQLGSPMHGEYTTGHKDTEQTIPCFE